MGLDKGPGPIKVEVVVKLHRKKARVVTDKIMSKKLIELKKGLHVRIKDQRGHIHPGTIQEIITPVGIQCGEGRNKDQCITISAICSIMFIKDIFIEKYYVKQNDVNGVN
jgi:hypothetical protein